MSRVILPTTKRKKRHMKPASLRSPPSQKFRSINISRKMRASLLSKKGDKLLPDESSHPSKYKKLKKAHEARFTFVLLGFARWEVKDSWPFLIWWKNYWRRSENNPPRYKMQQRHMKLAWLRSPPNHKFRSIRFRYKVERYLTFLDRTKNLLTTEWKQSSQVQNVQGAHENALHCNHLPTPNFVLLGFVLVNAERAHTHKIVDFIL